MPLSGLLAEYGFDGGWPSIFYIFGLVGVLWSVAFLIFVHEDPTSHPNIDEKEKKYIISSLWGTASITVRLLIAELVWMVDSNFLFFFIVSACSIQSYHDIAAFLRHSFRPYGSELWLRNVDDRIAHIHEASFAFLDQRGK